MATNIFGITDTFTLLNAVEQFKPEATYLADTFFPTRMPVSFTSFVSVEYKKGKRLLAPYIVRGSKGVNVNRDTAQAKFYAAPQVGVRRILSIQDIEMRMFGETPVYSTIKPEERASAMQAQDLVDLRRMILNRKNQMAADILQKGGTTIKGFADDGQTVVIDELQFDWTGALSAQTPWTSPNAKIYDDIQEACERIAESTGVLPTLMLCGKNVEKYLRNNEEIFKWLMIPNRANLTMASFEPRYDSVNSRYIGTISSLGLEVRSYIETYTDDNGEVKHFLDPDSVIIANPGRGKQLNGAITLIEKDSGPKTYAAEFVPHYVIDESSQVMSLSLFSRFLLIPDVIDDWVTIKVK